MMHFCYECYAEREVRLVPRETEVPVRGETIRVMREVDECAVCGHRIPTPDSEGALLEAAYESYRRIHAVPSPEDIRAIRARYGLSQRSLARLLNWGAITVHRYERGGLPDAAHSAILRSLANPEVVLRLLDDPACKLSSEERTQVRASLAKRGAEERENSVADRLEDLMASEEPSEFTGYRRPSPERLVKMASYLAHRVPGILFRVRLMKLLFYADFYHFAREAVSISGFPYAALPMGPVPDRYQLFLAWAELKGCADTEVVDTSYGPGEVFISRVSYDGHFSMSEFRTLDTVVEALGKMTGTQLRELSHREPAWLGTSPKQRIPYSLANRLVGISWDPPTD